MRQRAARLGLGLLLICLGGLIGLLFGLMDHGPVHGPNFGPNDRPVVEVGPGTGAPSARAPVQPGQATAVPTAPAPQAAPPSSPAQSHHAGGVVPQWEEQAAPAPAAGTRPQIALVIDDVGPRRDAVKRVLELPGPVTLALLPYADGLPALAREARARGHELLVHVPMEPQGSEDPGPGALTLAQPAGELRTRLEAALSRFDGFVGINNHMGSRLTRDPRAMAVVMEVLKGRGLLFLDSRTAQDSVGAATARAFGVPDVARDVFLDHEIEAGAVRRQLAEVEARAKRAGHAVAIGHPHDVTLNELEAWLPGLAAKGFVLVPVTAIARRSVTG